MDQLEARLLPSLPTARRRFLGGSGLALSAGAIALLGGRDALAQAAGSEPAKDTAILNVALGLEHEAIAAYQLGAESGLLQKPLLDAALKFQGDHKAHRDALAATVRKLGGMPVEPKSGADYARALQADGLKSQSDVLDLAARLEMGAANAYLGVIPSLRDPALAKVAARIAADEATHWTTLNGALGRAMAGPLAFGA